MMDDNSNEYCRGVYRFSTSDSSEAVLDHKMTDEEYEVAMKKAYELLQQGKFSMRSCGLCNYGHSHMHYDEDSLLRCFDCGRTWLGNKDLTSVEA